MSNLERHWQALIVTLGICTVIASSWLIVYAAYVLVEQNKLFALVFLGVAIIYMIVLGKNKDHD